MACVARDWAAVDPGLLKQAMARFASGVVIATTRDGEGRPRGFTASSFTSLSMSPPLILVCLSRTAECHGCFSACERLAVNILAPEHEGLARLFATRGADKFSGDGFAVGAYGLPVVQGALATLICRAAGRFPGGDHTILTAEVEEVTVGEGKDAMVYYARDFLSVAPPVRRAQAAC